MNNLFIEVTEDHFDSQIGDANNLVFVAEIDIQGGAFTFIEQADTPDSFQAFSLLAGNETADAVEFINLYEGLSLDSGGLQFNIDNVNSVTTTTPTTSHILTTDGATQSKVTKENFLKDSISITTTIDALGDNDFVSVSLNGSNRKITKANLFAGFAGYTHPTFTERNITATGAEVINTLTTNNEGHVTGISLRTLTLANLGYNGATDANNYVHPSFTAVNVTTTGAQVIGNIQTNNQGHVNAISTRTITLANLGYTGATDANNYSHPTYTARSFNGDGDTAEVIASLSSDSTGHVTALTSRTLSLGHLGYTGDTDANNYSHPIYNSRSISATGAQVLSSFESDSSGHVTAITTRTLTLANLGYNGATDANNYVHPTYTNRLINATGAQVLSGFSSDGSGHVTSISTRTLTVGDIGALGASATAADSNQLQGIAASGFFRISSTTHNNGYLHVFRSNATSPPLYVNNTGAGPLARFFNGDTNSSTSDASRQVEITNAGGIIADDNIEGHDTSDIRVKSDIREIVNPLSAVKSFRTVHYVKQGKRGREVGLIAQDIVKEIPSVVKITKGFNLDDLHKIKQGGNELIAYAFGAIKQLSDQVDSLELELESRKGWKGFWKNLRGR